MKMSWKKTTSIRDVRGTTSFVGVPSMLPSLELLDENAPLLLLRTCTCTLLFEVWEVPSPLINGIPGRPLPTSPYIFRLANVRSEGLQSESSGEFWNWERLGNDSGSDFRGTGSTKIQFP